MEWKEVRLGEVIDYKKGFAFKSSMYNSTGTYIVRISDTTANSVDVSLCNCISPELAQQYTDYSLKTKDIIIATVGSWPTNPASIVGKVVRVPESADNALLNQNAVRIRSNGLVDSDYLYYLLKEGHFSKYLVGTAQGSANQASITLKDIFGYSFSAPSTKEDQRRIASILSSLDRKIELNNKINADLEEMAQSIFKNWFVDFEPFKDGEFVDSELGMIPEGWNVGTLGEFCKCLLGGTPSRSKEEYWNGEINWINSGEINKFRIVEASEKITELGLAKSATKLLPKKTTVLAITGATLGQVSLLEIDSCANQSVIGVLENAEVPYEYIYPFIKDRIEMLIQHQTGGAQQHINKDNVESLIFLLPTKNVLEYYISLVKPMYKRIESQSFENLYLSLLRDTLLPRLMSGEIEVPE